MQSKLNGSAHPLHHLSEPDIEQMFNLFQTHFNNTTKPLFLQDLASKNWVVLLRAGENQFIQGFSTLAFYQSSVNGQPVGVVYSGDTIIHPTYWGTPQLPRTWIKTVLKVGQTLPQPLYWLLISSGYKTYRFLSVFFKTFYPHHREQTPQVIQTIIHTLARQRFGDDYYPDLGVVRFAQGATPLREGVADLNGNRLKDPHVVFFVTKNPGHIQGDELVCLTQVHPNNFTPAGKRMAR